MTPPSTIPKFQDAKDRLEILASGRDPDTGKPMAFSNATIAALQLAAQSIDLTNMTLAYGAQKFLKKSVFVALLQQPSRPPAQPLASTEPRRALMHGQPWTAQQDAQLLTDFGAGAALSALANRYDRTPTAISMRLVHLGCLPATPAPADNTTTTRRDHTTND